MTAYLTQRLLLFIPTLVLVSFLAFGIMRILPGDPAIAMLETGPKSPGWVGGFGQ